MNVNALSLGYFWAIWTQTGKIIGLRKQYLEDG